MAYKCCLVGCDERLPYGEIPASILIEGFDDEDEERKKVWRLVGFCCKEHRDLAIGEGRSAEKVSTTVKTG